MDSLASALRLSGVGVAVNILLATAKVAAGILGNSYALIADGIESTTDIVSSIVVWSGLRISAIPADDDHPLFRRVSRVGEKLQSTALRSDAWHHRSDAITSLAAFVGISVALWGGPGYESADDWAALLACGVIAWNGARLLPPAINEIMDASIPPDLLTRIRSVAEAVEGIHGVGRCHVRKSGMDLFVDIHIKVPGSLSVRDGHALAHRVQETLCSAFAAIRWISIHVEPDDP
ncbi:MAG: cation transporter [Verrucomicrobia bacterium]|nr:cation transporter [Verrucomicrobiota bacterium]